MERTTSKHGSLACSKCKGVTNWIEMTQDLQNTEKEVQIIHSFFTSLTASRQRCRRSLWYWLAINYLWYFFCYSNCLVYNVLFTFCEMDVHFPCDQKIIHAHSLQQELQLLPSHPCPPRKKHYNFYIIRLNIIDFCKFWCNSIRFCSS